MKQKYCTSCGSPIPDGQGNSCSMCYGDISYGKDGYYAEWAEKQNELADIARMEEQQNIEERQRLDED
jgi:RNA polymerase-binding transcription factor DksA